jgi:hypothetical protein
MLVLSLSTYADMSVAAVMGITPSGRTRRFLGPPDIGSYLPAALDMLDAKAVKFAQDFGDHHLGCVPDRRTARPEWRAYPPASEEWRT